MSIYTINLGQDVYGGYVNVQTGLMMVTHGYIDLGSLTWAYTSGNHSRMIATLSGAKGAGSGITFNGLCEIYRTVPYNSVYNHTSDKILGISDNGTVWVYDSDYTSASDFTSAVNGKNLTYELATPQTYQLTPAQITQLLGQNNVSCSSGDVAVTQIWARRDRSIISRG